MVSLPCNNLKSLAEIIYVPASSNSTCLSDRFSLQKKWIQWPFSHKREDLFFTSNRKKNKVITVALPETNGRLHLTARSRNPFVAISHGFALPTACQSYTLERIWEIITLYTQSQGGLSNLYRVA